MRLFLDADRLHVLIRGNEFGPQTSLFWRISFTGALIRNWVFKGAADERVVEM